VELYLDKQSGLVVKRSAQTRSTEQGGALVTEETVYTDHQTVDGLKVPSKSVAHRDGSKYVELEATQVEVAEKANDAEFQRP
jgi:hypothetical protein